MACLTGERPSKDEIFIGNECLRSDCLVHLQLARVNARQFGSRFIVKDQTLLSSS